MADQFPSENKIATAQEMLKRYAQSYLEARRSGYSWAYLARRFGVWYLAGAVIAAISVLVLYWVDAPFEYYIFIAGGMLGCVLRDLRWFLFMQTTWRAATEKIIDWKKVEALAGETAAPAAPPR
ncbi:MAG: hypothetical protein ACREUW_21305 [Burkholderiales bacterium]